MPQTPPAPPSIAAHAPASPKAAVTPALWKDYLTLTKPEISFLVTISALAGFLLGSPEGIDGWQLLFTLVGVALTSAGACALNHYYEREIDAEMHRTAQRPLPAGRIPAQHARNFGMGLIAAGVGLVCPLVNPLTAGIAILSAVLYLYVYTPLKQKTTLNTLVGTIPGALPALGGWTAATGSFGWGGCAIFAILVFWQMPHFLSLAWMYRKDYARGGFAMTTVADESGDATARQTVAYTLLLVTASIMPFVCGVAGWLYTLGALLLGVYFLRPVFQFYFRRTPQQARRVLKASIYYIPLLVVLIVADRFI